MKEQWKYYFNGTELKIFNQNNEFLFRYVGSGDIDEIFRVGELAAFAPVLQERVERYEKALKEIIKVHGCIGEYSCEHCKAAKVVLEKESEDF